MIKTVQFNAHRDVGNPTTVAKVYDAQHADELIFLDITATVENRHFLFDIVRDVAAECFMPLTVGGGIRTLEQAREVLQTGADKVAINTAAVERPELINELARKFGKSTVVVSIDYKLNPQGRLEVFTHRACQGTGMDPVDWAREVDKRGAGEILLTCVDREGTMKGYDLETCHLVSEAVSIPVIISGGCGTIQDLVDGIQIGKASAVAAASIFHFTDQSIYKAHSHMREKGLPSRWRK
jgi:cyclase